MAYAHGCYSISFQLTLLSHSNPWLISLTKSVPNALASLCTALASAVYTLCHLRITPTIIHILLSITDHTTSIII
ncbi:ADE_G0016210.mRNA.1.CDS.1 [Saccharomyces cerevisiae]|nr:ADE_G0016210.mRNA.1.CDS.1 [Saccharomyces cerevisiae]CAI6635898.1 ADE_G0016210.mRNA.1.CDS.1 [Saccharomyces cerevisiae]